MNNKFERYYPNICLEELRKSTIKFLVTIADMLNVVSYFTKGLSIDWDFRVQYLRAVANFQPMFAFPH
jgi:hypothetical protein